MNKTWLRIDRSHNGNSASAASSSRDSDTEIVAGSSFDCTSKEFVRLLSEAQGSVGQLDSNQFSTKIELTSCKPTADSSALILAQFVNADLAKLDALLRRANLSKSEAELAELRDLRIEHGKLLSHMDASGLAFNRR